MLNKELSEIFHTMAEILEFLGDSADRFRIRAYMNASIAILEVPEDLKIIAREKRLREIPGIGEGIAKKIEEYIKTGKIKEYDLLQKTIPRGFTQLMKIPSLGPKKVHALVNKLHVTNPEELKLAIAQGKVESIPGFGKKSAQKLLEGMGIAAEHKGRRLLGEAYVTVQRILESMESCPGLIHIVPAGSVRRAEETIGDIDILAAGMNPKKIANFFADLPFVYKVIAWGETKVSILTKDFLQVDLRIVSEDQFGSAWQYFTGSKKHNIHLRTYAKSKGFKLSEYGFFKRDKIVASKTEEDCYSALGMQYIPPEMRTDNGEIELALKKNIPKLIGLKDIRGDLHCHSTWSDGIDSIEEMARAGIANGYEYIALTDHSPSLSIANGLKLDRLKKKKKEIDKLNNVLPIKILFGTEVDILADGKIDYPIEILKIFDIVVASIHSRFKQDNTKRILKAMENPYVHIIGHLSGRKIGKRNPYELDYDMIFKKASETNTVLEINSHYERLDLTDIAIRNAKRWKCKFAINTDSHSARTSWLMELGVAWARRGWVQSEEVVNTLPLKKLKAALK